MKIPHEEAAVDKEWEKLEKLERLPAWQVTKFNSKKEVIENAKKGTDCYIDGILSPQELEVGAAVPKVASCSEVMVREATPQQVWTLLPDFLDAKDKQATQYPLTPRSK